MKPIYGLIGNPVAHSMSPDIHNAALKDLSLDGYYHAFRVENDDLEDAVKGMRALGIQGFNVTVPHKVAIMKYLDRIDESARVLGAVNTVRREKEELVGYNTDGEGFLKSLKPSLDKPVSELSILIIGAGGAARAIFTTLASERPKRLDVANRTPEKAEAFIQLYSGQTKAVSLAEAEEHLEAYDVLIQTTSVGMHPHVDDVPLSLARAKETCLVCDIIYNPLKTALLKEAEAKGLHTLNGVGMFIGQAALSFGLWTGHEPDMEKMKSIVLRKLGGKEC
ncbi:shikimate dehydrogenase [Bacillus sonorensis]|uniref:Shikimate dehydrogenase (NADP(+)) n=2 Tax=Bacillus sonorensis TaxID=119858 RepID=M5P682_9BACI|nr:MULTISPECIES: shikimate dehydrogenase [Bacillus]TWK76219.1 Shikimate dehydrogenase (NADP(+)) [Bacillus paralicheniformis]ASB88283.1 Shikimate dehydrogenase [Bacillus sonorensis]EME74953.1 shikimate 5-dehydrogenase [Bacillus sonorensis L12]MBG9916139.1 shikimate dehydrogenase [Bacillus sonorensis]MCF7617719.1 shikimate dehydrogenase [Bacillus sonorensis]